MHATESDFSFATVGLARSVGRHLCAVALAIAAPLMMSGRAAAEFKFQEPNPVCVMWCDGPGNSGWHPNYNPPPAHPAPVPQLPPAAKIARQHLERANAAYKNGHFDDAVAEISACLKLEPNLNTTLCKKWSAFLDVKNTLDFHRSNRMLLQQAYRRLKDVYEKGEQWALTQAEDVSTALCSVCDGEAVDGAAADILQSDPVALRKAMTSRIADYAACKLTIDCAYSRVGLRLVNNLKRCDEVKPQLYSQCVIAEVQSAQQTPSIPPELRPDIDKLAQTLDLHNLRELPGARGLDKKKLIEFVNEFTGDTKCNRYAAAIGTMLKIPYFDHICYRDEKHQSICKQEHRKDFKANDMYEFLEKATLNLHTGWQVVDEASAQHLADKGKFVVAVAKSVSPTPESEGEHGHIAIVAPQFLGKDVDPDHVAKVGKPFLRDNVYNEGSVTSNWVFSSKYLKDMKVGEPFYAVWDPGR